MLERRRSVVNDLRGASRLAIDATTALTEVVEAMHGNLSPIHGLIARSAARDHARSRTGGVTGMVYQTIRGVTRVVGAGLHAALGPLAVMTGDRASTPGREAVVAVLNGVVGDHLAMTGNPLAIEMSLRRRGCALKLDRAQLALAVPEAGRRLLVLIHGLCMNDLQWQRDGVDLGEALARAHGWTPLALHYNTGLHVSDNGRQLAMLLEQLVASWPHPVDELAIVGYSMGGLVARSAVHHARSVGQRWPARLRKLVFLGTPHHGAPLERGGHRLDQLFMLTPYTAPFTRLAGLRSAGITDLRHGSLVELAPAVRDPRPSALGVSVDPREPVPLPVDVECFAIAGIISPDPGSLGARWIGDGLVPLDSALGIHDDPRMTLAFDDDHRWIGRGLRHLELPSHPEVVAVLRRWLT
jgi:hypothetical protein